VNLSCYPPCPGDGQCDDVPDEPVIGFVGSMCYSPNVRAVDWFGRAIWPHVSAAVPDASWQIIGRDPTRAVRRWGQRPNVAVTGFVGDVRAALRGLRVFICPVREPIGVQTKLIEALAAGRAAVVTPQAAAGIDYDDPPPFLVAGSAAEFAQAVVRLIRDTALARSLADRARRLAQVNYDAEDQMRRIEGWLQSDHGQAARTGAWEAISGADRPAPLPFATDKGAYL
jgi:glycosyltransferase involved in cell wall biosynthesis